MGKLIYSMITSLDGYVSGPDGTFDWVVDEEIHTFIDRHFAGVGTYLYGRRMYELMAYWETADRQPDLPLAMAEYARSWQAADKVVFSRTLTEPSTARTRIESTFDPDAVAEWKAASDLDFTIDGPTIAAEAIRAGLVDEYHLFVAPVVVGGGLRFFPDGVHLNLEQNGETALANGLILLEYATA